MGWQFPESQSGATSLVRGVITTISVACLGQVCTITIADQTPVARQSSTYRVTRDASGKLTTDDGLKPELQDMLIELAKRSYALQ